MRYKVQSGVYVIKNTVNNKIYIGSAVNITKRFLRHKQDLTLGIHSNTYLQRAWNKYGESGFTFKVHLRCDKDKLISNEQIIIDASIKRLGRNNVYNICEIAGSTLGRKPTVETLKKMSESSKGRRHTEEARMKMSKAKKGKKLSLEHRSRLSESHKGYKLPEEQKRKISVANKRFYVKNSSHMLGSKQSEDTRKKRSESLKKYYVSNSGWMLGRKHSAETKMKIRKAQLGRVFSEEHKRNISIAHNRYLRNRTSVTI